MDSFIPKSGPFKGMEVTFASAEGLRFLQGIVDGFLLRILGYEPGSCFLTDESCLSHFLIGGATPEEQKVELKQINGMAQAVYGADISDLDNLLDIAKRISGA